MQNPYVDSDNTMPDPIEPQQPPTSHPGSPTVPIASQARQPYPGESFGSWQSGPGVYHTPSEHAAYQPAPGQFPVSAGPTPPPRRSRGTLRTGAIALLALVLLLVFGVGLFAGWHFGRTSVASPTSPTGLQQGNNNSSVPIPTLTSNNIQAVREAVIANVRPAVVEVNVTTSNGSAIGLGVIIDQRGYIVTNNHVVSGAQSIEVVLSNGTHLTAQLTGTDPADDLAVIKVTPPSSGLTVAKLGDSSKLKVGEEVLAIGNPLGITQTVTNGIVSAVGRAVSEGQGGATLPDAIQTDAPINPGNSGGALVDLQGNLVGIPTLTAIDPEFNTPASGVGFAIPSNRVAFIVPQIIQYGRVIHTGRAILGVSVTTVNSQVAQRENLKVNFGALITNLESGGPAASAGLQVGDVITQIGNTPINDVDSLSQVMVSLKPGQTAAVHVNRNGQELTINVQLGELPAS